LKISYDDFQEGTKFYILQSGDHYIHPHYKNNVDTMKVSNTQPHVEFTAVLNVVVKEYIASC